MVYGISSKLLKPNLTSHFLQSTMADIDVFLGVVQVPISQLQFARNDCRVRQFQQHHKDYLQGVFRTVEIKHEDPKHWIKGRIDHSQVQSVLHWLQLSREQIQWYNVQKIYPLLENHVVQYAQGRHRIKAARELDHFPIWTVELYASNLSDSLTNEKIAEDAEEYHHETAYAFGHIYSKLREYHDSPANFARWHAMLESKIATKAFNLICQRPNIIRGLDQLIEFPGVIHHATYGNWHKWFSYRLEPEIEACLEHVYDCYSQIARPSPMHRYLDADTARLLEGRWPAMSQSDQHFIHQAFEDMKLFSEVNDLQERREIERKINEMPIMFPGLRSFSANMMYLGIAAQIIWSLLIPPELRTAARKKQKSLRATLKSCWISSAPYVEVEEGIFRRVHGSPSFDLTYNQVMLAAIRQFPYLSYQRPKMEPGEELAASPDPRCVALFRRRAHFLGLRNRLIQQSLDVWLPAFTFKQEPRDGVGESALLRRVECRWGRPSLRIFRAIQQVAFLPQLQTASDISVEYILRNFMSTFFEVGGFEYDTSQPPISVKEINQHSGNQDGHISGQQDMSREMNELVDHSIRSNLMDIDVSPSPDPSVPDEDVIMQDRDTPEDDSNIHIWPRPLFSNDSTRSAQYSTRVPSGIPMNEFELEKNGDEHHCSRPSTAISERAWPFMQSGTSLNPSSISSNSTQPRSTVPTPHRDSSDIPADALTASFQLQKRARVNRRLYHQRNLDTSALTSYEQASRTIEPRPINATSSTHFSTGQGRHVISCNSSLPRSTVPTPAEYSSPPQLFSEQRRNNRAEEREPRKQSDIISYDSSQPRSTVPTPILNSSQFLGSWDRIPKTIQWEGYGAQINIPSYIHGEAPPSFLSNATAPRSTCPTPSEPVTQFTQAGRGQIIGDGTNSMQEQGFYNSEDDMISIDF
ncbi:hypothetical protein S7711_09959 [Stachybotrys chartarum IBT 7711]|uniref:Uncharacterized protein n=1 Tax=Stachybotrys chartarum (strain CBS 109288 / IBT 7711) TaxID=1280523 RepID=A0A084B948_STACB|nr:hypothetical protein S7711_09959 [Stachybotrys chartarum IBT 7711]